MGIYRELSMLLNKNNKMLNPKELRFGNLVEHERLIYPQRKVGWVIEETTIQTFNELRHKYWKDRWRAIPVTPEMLEKLGFEKDGFGSYTVNVGLINEDKKRLSICDDYVYLREVDTAFGINDDIVVLYSKDIRGEIYIHQIQNFYFDLTGKELELKK